MLTNRIERPREKILCPNTYVTLACCEKISAKGPTVDSNLKVTGSFRCIYIPQTLEKANGACGSPIVCRMVLLKACFQLIAGLLDAFGTF